MNLTMITQSEIIGHETLNESTLRVYWRKGRRGERGREGVAGARREHTADMFKF